MNVAARKIDRPRERARIGADRARSWVRDFNLRNPYAKSILMAVANYMNEDGAAWPGLATLSRDTDITEDTIASRLRWCESIGIIVVLKCWVDENGRRNYEKRGRPTSSEIRFQFDADIDEVEQAAYAAKGEQPLRGAAARAHADRATSGADGDHESEASDSNDSGFSHRRGGGQTDEPLPPGSTQLAPDQPPPAAVRSLEVKQEDSPLTPQAGGDGQQSSDQGSEPTWPHEASWQRVEKAWDDPILHQQICRDLWTAFTDIERERFIKVVRGYLAWRLKQPKLPNRCNIQKLMRERESWPGYEKLAGPDPALRTFVAENSIEHKALQVIERLGNWTPKPVTFDPENNTKGFWRGRPLKPDEIAMAQFADVPAAQWKTLERTDGPSYFAWSDRLFDWTGVRKDSIRVPCAFPPRKDGTLSGSSTDPPSEESAA